MKCAINDTIAYIKILAQDLAGCDPSCALLAILFDLSIPAHFDGFEYLKAAIVIQYEEPSQDLVNNIYEKLAKHYGVSSYMVSSAIHSAVKTAWSRTTPATWCRYLPTAPLEKGGAPSNAEVIAGLARTLEFWQGCSNAYLRQQHQEVVSCGR